MKPPTLAGITVFVRIGLYFVSGLLVSRGLADTQTVEEIRDPMTVELVAGIVAGVISMFWYWLSEARKALKDFAK